MADDFYAPDDAAAAGPKEYDDRHRLLAQSLLSHKAVNAALFRELPRNACVDAIALVDTVDGVVDELNDKLRAIGMEVRRGVCEVSGSVYYALVNSTYDPRVSQIATTFRNDEIAFYKHLIDEIIEGDTGRIGERAAINIGQQHGTLTARDAEETIGRLVSNQWLKALEGGSLTLGWRGFLELRPYLAQKYPESLRSCTICAEPCVLGDRCPNKPCLERMHSRCAAGWFRKRTGQLVCPSCKRPWDKRY
eukprot:m51a1_g11005 hypothetical protein (249) ;mRNA; f:362897-363911